MKHDSAFIVHMLCMLAIPASAVVLALGLRMIYRRWVHKQRVKRALALQKAWDERTPFLRFAEDDPPCPITWDESKMTEDQKRMLLPRIKR